MTGAFVTFEGGDGAGKSTQTQRLAQRLRALGRKVMVTREPGGSPFAEKLRAALLSDQGAKLNATEQALMFAAARADHVATQIEPALKAGQIVICDRFADSTEAYQGAAGAPPKMLAALNALAVGSCAPDLTFVLDCPVNVGQVRTASRGATDQFERDRAEIQQQRRQAFLDIAAREPQRCYVIDATLPTNAVADAIWRIASQRLALYAEA